jgi:Ankyrin repeats (3 copies)
MASTGTESLSPAELEELHLRYATAASLNDDTESRRQQILGDILSRKEECVPMYPGPQGSLSDSEESVREKIAARDKDAWDSIWLAIANGQIDVVDHFLTLGFEVNSLHPFKAQYPIFVAVKASQTNMMRHLINLGAEVNCWNVLTTETNFFWESDKEKARTPLMSAAEDGNLNICKILCETAFADPMLVAPDGQTAQRLAAKKGHREIVQYLPAHRGGVYRRLRCIPYKRIINGR